MTKLINVCMATVLMALVMVGQADAAGLRRRELRPWYCFFLKNNPRCKETCPKVNPTEPFSLDRYIEKSWFVQKQQVNGYQSEDQLNCVAATYNKEPNSNFILVENYGNNGEPNGPSQISDGSSSIFSRLCAESRSDTSGKLAVAPCIFKPFFGLVAGDYWVLAVDQENYSWAIISGGQPTETVEGDAGTCTTKLSGINGSGLWLFTREKIASPATISAMEAKLKEMGVSTKLLLPVNQEGCRYEGANLK